MQKHWIMKNLCMNYWSSLSRQYSTHFFTSWTASEPFGTVYSSSMSQYIGQLWSSEISKMMLSLGFAFCRLQDNKNRLIITAGKKYPIFQDFICFESCDALKLRKAFMKINTRYGKGFAQFGVWNRTCESGFHGYFSRTSHFGSDWENKLKAENPRRRNNNVFICNSFQ